MGASASVIEATAFNDTTIVDNESVIKKWDGVDEETFEQLKNIYETIKSEPKDVVVQKMNEVYQNCTKSKASANLEQSQEPPCKNTNENRDDAENKPNSDAAPGAATDAAPPGDKEQLDLLKNHEDLLSNQAVVDAQKEFLLNCGKYIKGRKAVSVGAAKDTFSKGMRHNELVQRYTGLSVNDPEWTPDWFDCNVRDEDGWTALHHACGEGHLSIVQWLLSLTVPESLIGSSKYPGKFCIDVDVKADDQCTPLWVAGFNGNRDIVQHLLMAGADDTIKGCPEDEPQTTPALACRRNRQPGLADFLDAERQLRLVMTTDEAGNEYSARLRQQQAREMTLEEHRESIRSLTKAKQTVA